MLPVVGLSLRGEKNRSLENFAESDFSYGFFYLLQKATPE